MTCFHCRLSCCPSTGEGLALVSHTWCDRAGGTLLIWYTDELRRVKCGTSRPGVKSAEDNTDPLSWRGHAAPEGEKENGSHFYGCGVVGRPQATSQTGWSCASGCLYCILEDQANQKTSWVLQPFGRQADKQSGGHPSCNKTQRRACKESGWDCWLLWGLQGWQGLISVYISGGFISEPKCWERKHTIRNEKKHTC